MDLLSTNEIAEKYNVGLRTVLRWINRGQLRATKYGRTWMVERSDLENFTQPRSGAPWTREQKPGTIHPKARRTRN